MALVPFTARRELAAFERRKSGHQKRSGCGSRSANVASAGGSISSCANVTPVSTAGVCGHCNRTVFLIQHSVVAAAAASTCAVTAVYTASVMRYICHSSGALTSARAGNGYAVMQGAGVSDFHERKRNKPNNKPERGAAGGAAVVVHCAGDSMSRPIMCWPSLAGSSLALVGRQQPIKLANKLSARVAEPQNGVGRSPATTQVR